MTDAGWRAGGLILERIAGEGGSHVVEDEAAEASWETATILAGTLSTKELLDDSLPTLQLLHRLFHEEDLHVSQPRALAFGCRCSRARLANVLETFPQDDLDHMCQDDGNIVMTCEFCNVDFRFARKNIATQAQ